MKSTKGSALVIGLIAVVFLVVVGGLTYAFFSKKGLDFRSMYGNDSLPRNASSVNVESQYMASPSPVGNSNDVDTIQTELDQTTVNSVDVDFQQLDSSASSL